MTHIAKQNTLKSENTGPTKHCLRALDLLIKKYMVYGSKDKIIQMIHVFILRSQWEIMDQEDSQNLGFSTVFQLGIKDA